MKKKLMLSFIAVVAAAGSLMAQSAVQESQTPEYKTKMAVSKITTDLTITEEQRVKAMAVFNWYYKKRATSPADTDKSKRDTKLQTIFTESQMTAFTEKIEPVIE